MSKIQLRPESKKLVREMATFISQNIEDCPVEKIDKYTCKYKCFKKTASPELRIDCWVEYFVKQTDK